MPRSDQLSREDLLERQAFQLALLTELRDLADPVAILAAAATRLGTHLGATRCGFASNAGEAGMKIASEWTKDGASRSGEVSRLQGATNGELAQGDTVVTTGHKSDDHSRHDIAAQILCPMTREGVLESVRDANIGLIFGIGFAPWSGGAIQYINQYGVAQFVERAKVLAKRYGARFNPPQLLLDKAAKGEMFR